MRLRLGLLGAVVVLAVLAPAGARRSGDASAHAQDKVLLDNEHVTVMEVVFPAGFKGEEHEAPVNELAYVLDGRFSVVTKGKGTTVVRKGEVEYAPKGTVHYSINDTRRPARVLVVMLKER